MAQQAFVLWFADEGNTNLGALNALLERGWNVSMASPMSGTGEEGNETPQSPFPYSRAALVLEPVRRTKLNTQLAFVLWFADEGATNLGGLNARLEESWTVSLLIAMSGTGEHGSETPQSPFPYSRALAILRR